MFRYANERINKIMESYDLLGFAKVGEEYGSYNHAIFFNPDTLKEVRILVYDWDNQLNDKPDLNYDVPIVEEIKAIYDKIKEEEYRDYCHKNGMVTIGDYIEVYKGRKVPKGTRAIIVSTSYWKDCYGRIQTIYAHLDNGMKTNIDNCRLVIE